MNFLYVFLTFLNSIGAFAHLNNEAFGKPGNPGSWSSAKKVQVGTTFEVETANSPLWFTAAEGILTEVYFPTIDQAQIRDSQLLITDGKSFFAQEKDLEHQVQIISPSLVKIINVDKKNKYRITHTFYPHKSSAVLIDEIEIETSQSELKFYLLTNPQLNNTAANDSVKTSDGGFVFHERKTKLLITTNVGFIKKSVGFVGFSDGYQDLVHDFTMDFDFTSATNGNVASMGEINLPQKSGSHRFFVVYDFGQEKNLRFNFAQERKNYEADWQSYLNSLKIPAPLTPAQKLLYLRSLYTLKCHEDKINPGAFIASLSVPWGESQIEIPEQEIGGYHLIWPRDLFNVSVAMLNSGDYQAALRALRFLQKIQYKNGSGAWYFYPRIIEKAGAFPQNTWVTGRNYWEGFQIDQTAFPVHLFYHLYLKTPPEKRAALMTEFSPMLYAALDFIVKYGPWTHQERWEENYGISPSSFAAAASALYMGSRLFKNKAGEHYQEIAELWMHKPNDNIDTWTFTRNGIYGEGQYYLRIAGGSHYGANWDPNDRSSINIANSSFSVKQIKVLDQGFMQLVLLGLKPGNSKAVKVSKSIVDQEISRFTPKGQGWFRYSFDAYGDSHKLGRGQLWPLLSGEHARYLIERFTANDLSWNEAISKINPITESFLNFANDGLMIPEQVYEDNGLGTGAATPLAWAHAEYLKLLWSLDQKKNIENVLEL